MKYYRYRFKLPAYTSLILFFSFKKPTTWGFPGAAVVKNPPANAGDTGSSPATKTQSSQK